MPPIRLRFLRSHLTGARMHSLKTFFVIGLFAVAATANTPQGKVSDAEYIRQALSAAPASVAKAQQ